VKIAFIGGTGPEGKGLAYRFAVAAHETIVGSRSAERAGEAAREIGARVSTAVRGADNADAARDADVVVLTVPYDAQAATLPALRDAIGPKIVVSTAVPLSFEGGKPSMHARGAGGFGGGAGAGAPSRCARRRSVPEPGRREALGGRRPARSGRPHLR
jgi:NADPH-dependent F420 reductase